MELKIISKKEDPLLSRTKIEVEVVFEKATPSSEEIKSKLATDLGKDGKLIVVKGIYTIRGLKKAKNISYVYENEDYLKRIEVGKKESGKKAKEEVKSEEKPAKKEKKEEQKTEQKEVKGEEKQKEVKQEAQKTHEQKGTKEKEQ